MIIHIYIHKTHLGMSTHTHNSNTHIMLYDTYSIIYREKRMCVHIYMEYICMKLYNIWNCMGVVIM